MDLMTTAKTMAEVLAEHRDIAWDHVGGIAVCGGCDDLLGPLSVDMEVQDRWLITHQAAALSAAGFGLVTDAKAEALEEAADDFESNVGVGEFVELSRRDGAYWNHIYESWEHQGPYMDWLRNRADDLRGDS